jgi:pimeloyl-ACP methyl ester carboxylesterase
MADSQVPLAVSTLSKKTRFLVASNDQIIPPDVERTYAKRMAATTVEVPASHVAYVSHPDAVARLIEEAAKTAGAK